MTINQKRKILIKIQKLEQDIEKLEDVIVSLASNEYASATLSSGGGSKSYTRADVGSVERTLDSLKRQLESYRALLSGTYGFKTTYICWR